MWFLGALILVLLGAIGAQAELSEVEDFSFDEEGRLSGHLFVTSTGKCMLEITRQMRNVDSSFRTPETLAKDSTLHNHFLEKYAFNSQGCYAVCLERGTPRDQVLSAMPHQVYDGKGQDMVLWYHRECQSAEVGFVSYNENPVDIFWEGNDALHLKAQIEKGEKHTFWSSSFLGHVFVIKDSVTKEELKRVVVEHNGFYSIGQFKSLRQDMNMEPQIKRVLDSEWSRSRRVTRTFTELGFAKGRLPDDLWGSISAYYYNNKDRMIREEWESKGPFVNWWEVDAFMIQMPWQLKRTWQSRLKLLVEAWSNTELENTDIYGMRQYERGARLLHHVDREATHAASLIINVAQSVQTPWTVEIYDLADRLHEVVMEPGDIVYYESAKCLHGRNTPLDGDYYVNLFAHYRPIGDDSWFLRPNPEGTPPALMDIGKCKVKSHAIMADDSSVVCDDASVNTMSPTLHTVSSSKDLYNWWKYSANRAYDGDHSEL